MECPLELTHEGRALNPSSLVELATLEELPSITFNGPYNQFTLDFSPSKNLLSKTEKKKRSTSSKKSLCHFEGTDQLGRQSWLSACSIDDISLILHTSTNVFYLRVLPNGRFVLLPQTFPSCEISTGNRSKRQTRVAKANPDYYSEFAEVLQRRRFVEFAFIADHSLFEKYEKDEEKVNDRLHTLANMMNSFYKPINIEIRLVYTEVWTDEDKMEVQADSDKTLDAFLTYRKTFLRAHPNDNAHLLTDVHFANGVVGKAFKGTMCSFDYSGGVNVDHQKDAALVASTIAHEMGHNFGMDHDVDYDSTCKCPSKNGRTHCIMAPSAGYEAPSHWSDCSLNYLQTSLGRGVDLCLLNEPDRSEKAVCGNGIVEDGEDCDCGQAGCNNECCDASTCKLTDKATCASGTCCDLQTCQPKERATLCRKGANECDLNEYCDGETPECPADFFVQDGLKCPNDEDAYCYNGECGSRTEQCKTIWGPTGRAAADTCYMTNTQGKIHGNCGYDAHYDNYTACAEQDKFCGRLMCDKDTEAPIFGNPSSVTVANSHFFNRDKNAYDSCFVIKTAYETKNKRKHTPGMTLDGTKCAPNKVCLQTKCVPLTQITKTVSSCDDNCNGHGICNNVGNCHCVNGYGGVACNIPGLGGSVNSNPANMSRGTDVLIITIVFLALLIAGFIAATIHYKRKGKGFLPSIIWKEAKERLKLRGILVPTRKAPPPPRTDGHSRMKKNSLNAAWGDSGVVTYSANPPPLVAPQPISHSFSSPSSSPDPLLPPPLRVNVDYHKPDLVAPAAISPRPRDPPPSVPTRPRDSAIVKLYSDHGPELGIRSQAPAPPPVKKENVSSLNRSDTINRPEVRPPPPPHKPKIQNDSKAPPPLPAKPNLTKEGSVDKSEASSIGVRNMAARFEKK